jgi:hypothetical protein
MGRHLDVILIHHMFTVDDEGSPMLNIDHDAIGYREGEAFPTSACATPCASHQVKIQVGLQLCINKDIYIYIYIYIYNWYMCESHHGRF